MGRGLSPLQHQILKLALEREQERRGAQRALFPYVIYAQVYGWPITRSVWWPDRDRNTRAALWFNAGHHFRPEGIGVKRYRAAVVAVSRSLGRLAARGLLMRQTPYHGGWVLTDAGRRVVIG
jgi:hypothetical protein